MLNRVELIPARVREDGDATLSEDRLVAIEVEQVAEAHADDQHRIHRRVDVVRTEVGHADRDDVRLPLDANAYLVSHRFQCLFVHRIDLAGMHASQPIRRAHGVEDIALECGRRHVGDLLHAEEHRLILGGPVRLAFLHEVGDRWKSVVVDSRLDVKDADCVLDQLTLPYTGVMQGGVRRVHVRERAHQCLHVVMDTDSAIGGETSGHRLVAAVHRHQRQVHVDDEV